MKLSIILPVYNAERFLNECLESIVPEMNNDVELIIVDDGSTDSSNLIYNRFKKKNVKIYINENHGVSYSRNYGIEKSCGEYITFVDADDFMTKGWYNKIFKVIQENKDVDFIIYSTITITQKQKLLEYIFMQDNQYYLSTPWSKIYRRSILNQYNIRFNENVINGEDMLFNAEVVLSTNSILCANCNIYNYRTNSLSATQTFNEKIFQSDKIFLESLRNLFEKNNLDYEKYYKHCIENAIVMFVNKLSLLRKRKRKEYYKIFKEEPYSSFIKDNTIYEKKSNKIIINQIKKGRIDNIISICSFKRNLKNVFKFKRLKTANKSIIKV